MRAHVAEAAAGVFAVAPPLGEMAMNVGGAQHGAKGALGCRAKPHVPVDAVGFFLGEQITGKAGGANADLDFADFTHAAVADAFHGLAEVTAKLRALLAADLIDDVVFAGGFHGLQRGADGDGEGFLAVHILLGLGGHDGRDRVPMIRSADHHGIDAFVSEGFAEILGGFAGVVGAVFIGDTLEAVIEAHLGDFG